MSHTAGLFAAATHLHGRRQDYRSASKWGARSENWISLEIILVAGDLAFAVGLAVLLSVVSYWSRRHFGVIGNVLPAVIGTTLVAIGAQNALGGFLLTIVNDHEAEFLKSKPSHPKVQTEPAAVEPQPDFDGRRIAGSRSDAY